MSKKYLLRLFGFLYLFPYAYCATEAKLQSESLQRNRRQLLFPNNTLLQFNAGIGTPSPVKDINVNFAFQANFQLPWNRSQIPVDILLANSGYDGPSRQIRDIDNMNSGSYDNDARLYHFYKYIEDMLNSFGYNGTACVKKTLCQLGSEPLHSDDDEDLLHELATFVLNPRNDLIHQSVQQKEIFPYIEAYNLGQKSEDCLNSYQECNASFVDLFTKQHDPS
ncbi:uncharacterized protein LOC114243786 [Bombyx mandarina]|uniref:Uncharacterized protein LOC114243786 n=1 Tax=Bombyx mandarina TaxID=7092 RepID=A0A6J2JQC9_BOMMA|nr:uncharacterized protein LOC114243786 [Bombyx mandarina]